MTGVPQPITQLVQDIVMGQRYVKTGDLIEPDDHNKLLDLAKVNAILSTLKYVEFDTARPIMYASGVFPWWETKCGDITRYFAVLTVDFDVFGMEVGIPVGVEWKIYDWNLAGWSPMILANYTWWVAYVDLSLEDTNLEEDVCYIRVSCSCEDQCLQCDLQYVDVSAYGSKNSMLWLPYGSEKASYGNTSDVGYTSDKYITTACVEHSFIVDWSKIKSVSDLLSVCKEYGVMSIGHFWSDLCIMMTSPPSGYSDAMFRQNALVSMGCRLWYFDTFALEQILEQFE